jgi:hypothetical protein
MVNWLYVHISIEVGVFIAGIVGYYLLRDKAKQIMTWDREHGKEIPKLDENGDIIYAVTERKFERMVLLIVTAVILHYYAFIFWLKPWETLSRNPVAGIYHIVLGLLLPIGCGAGSWFGFKLGIGRGIVLTVQKMVPYRVEKKRDSFGEVTGELEIKVDESRNESDPCASDTFSVFIDSERKVKKCVATLRESMNNLHEVVNVPYKILKKNLGTIKFFGDKVVTSYVWYGYMEVIANIHGREEIV